LSTPAAWAQTPTTGLIFKPATAGTPGAAVLDPNNDGYVSATATGFSGTNDLGTASEIPYRYLPQVVAPREPMADLRVGPSTKFTDFADVSPNGGNSVGFFVDANGNYMFRFRLGGAAPNSKSYSVAIDTDNKFGFTGPNADPNAVLGNPGFEMEINLASNFGVRLYNLDGVASPTDPGLDGVFGPDNSMIELPYDSYAHKAIAATTNDGTLDVFYDFYIPISVIQAQFGSRTFFSTNGTSVPFSLSTPLRMVANTIIAPHSVTQYQNISDIGGLANVPSTDGGFIQLINNTTPTSGSTLPPGNSIPAKTQAPGVNCPVIKGATTLTGTSTEAVGTVITVFVNGVAQSPTTTVQTGGTWSVTVAAVPAGALVKATALAAGKSLSDYSNECQASTTGQSACSTPPPPVPSCIDPNGRGISSTLGAAYAGYKVYLRYLDGTLVPHNNGVTNGNFNTLIINPVVADVSGYFLITGKGGSACTNGQQNVLGGTYLLSYEAPTSTGNPSPCESQPMQICINTGTTATPTVTTPRPITPNTTTIAGTAVAGARVTLSIDGSVYSGVTANATTGAYTFSVATSTLPTLTAGRILAINAATNTTCASSDVTLTVVTPRTVIAPIVTAPLLVGGTTVSGSSVEAPGSVITLYTYSNTLGTGVPTGTYTTTVQTDGSWSVTVSALAANSSVAATVTPVDYNTSGFSNVVPVRPCSTSTPTITGIYNEGDTSVSGTLSVAPVVGTPIVVTILEDSYPIGTVTVTTGTTWSLTGLSSGSGVAPNTPYPDLYAGGVLTATAATATQQACTASNAVTVGCPNLAAKALNAAAVCVGNSASFTITNVQPGVVYTLLDASNAAVAPSKLGTGTGSTSLTFTTPVYPVGTYPMKMQTFSVGAAICTATSSTVNLTVNPLPLTRTITSVPVTTYQAALTGTNVVVTSSQVNISYQLVNTSATPNVYVGSPQTGTGADLNLPTGRLATNVSSTSYAVIGTNLSTGCQQQVGTRTVTYSGPLPVELSGFDVAASNSDAVLTWTTASEKNNARFDVQRSMDGREFATVGHVMGQGNSTQVQGYSYRDAGAARVGSQLYYRLQQVDYDGSMSISPVRVVKFISGASQPSLQLFPNPATNAVTCRLESAPAGDYTVSILTLTGKVLTTIEVVGGRVYELPLDGLPTGVYLVQVKGAKLRFTERLIKLQ